MIKKCIICGKEFRTCPSKIKLNHKFCSRECMGKWHSKNLSGKNHYKWKGGNVIVKCKICGNEFLSLRNRINKGQGIFCSMKCHGIWLSQNIQGENNYRWKGGKIEKSCVICGGKFKTTQWYIDRNNGKFCSRKCYGINRHNMPKEKQSNWKGGLTAPYEAIRRSLIYKDWRNRIYTRDNFTCRACGCKNKINAHHIKRFSIILNDIREKFPLLSIIDISKNHDELWDIKNGITLCKDCHRKEHLQWRQYEIPARLLPR